ncbi:type II secretion system protein M [Sphingobium phenoxybenzoativorans]|uniref:Type II secretion system protein M n=1 Tax=Sphingobium phenoxybenzoativorans TaxID=1592790 RepID=A0A975KAB7_9SPHN|nr:type II secretion system protein GspM [Sphingobium phenoxybenzoativorans]QUT07724.1 type II secretion system protein M [Sphingobium phenoxybenzoativorans]
MIANLAAWYKELSKREQVLVGIMAVLLAIVILWLGIARPVESGLKSAIERHGVALDRNAAVRVKVASLKALPRGAAARPATPIAQLVSQSAGEGGFTLERTQEQGPGRVDIAIASIRPKALFTWLANLEAQGVVVETFSAQPSGTAGAVSMQAVLKAAGQ